MKKIVLTALSSLFFTANPGWVLPVLYDVDPLQTSVLWSVSHYGFSIVHGKFTRITGKMYLDQDQPELSTFKIIITMDYNYTGIDNLDAQLKTKNFFNTQIFPEAIFTSKKIIVVDKDKGRYNVEGILELNSFKKPVVLNVVLNKIGIQPLTQRKTVGFSASTSLQRTEYGMSFGLPDIGNDVQLNIQLEASIKNLGEENEQ